MRQEDDGVEERAGDEREKSREEPASAPAPEAEQVYAARAAAPFGEQQRRDEIAADDEEYVDADEAATKQADLGVVKENGRDGERTQAVDRRNVGEKSRSPTSDGVVRRLSGDLGRAADRAAVLAVGRAGRGDADSRQETEKATETNPATQGETSD